MTTRRCITFLSMVLLVILLAGLTSPAFADSPACGGFGCGQQSRWGAPDCTYNCDGWTEAARKDVLSQFLACLMAAECESDTVSRAFFYREADELWNLYREMIFEDTDYAMPWEEDCFEAPWLSEDMYGADTAKPVCPVQHETVIPGDIEEMNGMMTDLFVDSLVDNMESAVDGQLSAAQTPSAESDPYLDKVSVLNAYYSDVFAEFLADAIAQAVEEQLAQPAPAPEAEAELDKVSALNAYYSDVFAEFLADAIAQAVEEQLAQPAPAPEAEAELDKVSVLNAYYSDAFVDSLVDAIAQAVEEQLAQPASEAAPVQPDPYLDKVSALNAYYSDAFVDSLVDAIAQAMEKQPAQPDPYLDKVSALNAYYSDVFVDSLIDAIAQAVEKQPAQPAPAPAQSEADLDKLSVLNAYYSDAFADFLADAIVQAVKEQLAQPAPEAESAPAQPEAAPAQPEAAPETEAAPAQPDPYLDTVSALNAYYSDAFADFLADAIVQAVKEQLAQPASETEAAPAQPEAAAADGDDALAETDAASDPTDAGCALPPFFGMPNPWTETNWLDEAISVSGVQMDLPAKDSLPRHMNSCVLRAVPGTLEVDYTNGEEKLMIRASLDDEGYVLSGDYNNYSTMWTEEIGGVTVDCLGDGQHINVATFRSGDLAYAVTMACGVEGSGLTAGELGALIESMHIAPAADADAEAVSDSEAEAAVVTETDVLLTTLDHDHTDELDTPVRMVRSAETNLGDFVADAYRVQGGADIGLVNSGGLCGEFGRGTVSCQDLFNVSPFGDSLCVAEVTGQQILDTLEWACRMLPDETGSFLQVSGLSFEVHTDIDSPCLADVNGKYVAIMGERRVKNVMVGGEPLDPGKTYTVAASDYVLLSGEDGNTAFTGAKLLKDRVQPDTQLLIDYVIDACGGIIGDEYADPHGQGRIVIVASDPEAQTEAETEPEAKAEAESETEPEAKAEAEAETEPEAKAEAESETEPEAKAGEKSRPSGKHRLHTGMDGRMIVKNIP